MPGNSDVGPLSVEAERLVFGYGSGRPVLDELSLSIPAAERVAIIGASGAGKSTFLLHLNGILQPLSGSVRIGHEYVRADNVRNIRGRVGIVFQNPDDQLFTPTVGEDVAFGPRNMGCSADETRVRVETALSQMRLEGYERRSIHELSFGEKRRVALATVLSMRPSVIAFDEPFANLDPAMVEQLITIIRGLEATVILISQEILPAIAAVNRLAVLHRGRIEAIGPALDIARDRALLRRCGVDFHFFGEIWSRISGGSPRLETVEEARSAEDQRKTDDDSAET